MQSFTYTIIFIHLIFKNTEKFQVCFPRLRHELLQPEEPDRRPGVGCWLLDAAEDSEYVYTKLEPDYCHNCFPCFDQPDLKGALKAVVLAPADWEVVSNGECTKSSPAVQRDSTDEEY